MNQAMAHRLIKKSRHSCIITPRTGGAVDANENPILADGTPSAPIDCLFVTPDSLRHAEVSTVEENGVAITHQIYLPGDTVVDRHAAISDIRYARGTDDEIVLHAGTLEVGRVNTSLLPFLITLNVGEVE